MDKDSLLREIRNAARQKVISKEDALQAFDEGAPLVTEKATQTKSIAEIISYVGGGIVVLGIAIFIGQHWSELNAATRIFATFGAGIASYVVGVIFSRYERFNLLSQVFFLISALTTPVGISIIFDNAGWDMGSAVTQSSLSGILLVAYYFSYVVFKKNIFTIFNIIFGTWLFFSLTDLMVGRSRYGLLHHFNEYRVLAAGLSYVLLGYHFSQTLRLALSRWLYAIGLIGFLSAAFFLGGWAPRQNILWEMLFPGLCIVVVFLSIYLKSKSFLIFGSLYLIGFFLKLTGEYFAHSLGWPLALILCGLGLIFIGYFSFYLNKKYLS